MSVYHLPYIILSTLQQLLEIGSCCPHHSFFPALGIKPKLCTEWRTRPLFCILRQDLVKSVAWAGLELGILLPYPPKKRWLQTCPTVPGLLYPFEAEETENQRREILIHGHEPNERRAEGQRQESWLKFCDFCRLYSHSSNILSVRNLESNLQFFSVFLAIGILQYVRIWICYYLV